MVFGILILLLSLTLVIFSFFTHKIKKQDRKTKELINYYKKVISDTDKAFINKLRHVLSPNVQYGLNKIIENALQMVVDNSMCSPFYYQRLIDLKKKNKQYTPIVSNSQDINLINIKGGDRIFNMSLVAQINKLRKVLHNPVIRANLSNTIISSELKALDYLQLRISVENRLDKVIRAIDIGNNGFARECLLKVKSVISKPNVDEVYKSKKLHQIASLEDQINNALYFTKKIKTRLEIQKDEEWEQVFRRHKQYIPLHL